MVMDKDDITHVLMFYYFYNFICLKWLMIVIQGSVSSFQGQEQPDDRFSFTRLQFAYY